MGSEMCIRDRLKSVLLTNDNVRKNRDWEDMIGRAIISGEKNND